MCQLLPLFDAENVSGRPQKLVIEKPEIKPLNDELFNFDSIVLYAVLVLWCGVLLALDAARSCNIYRTGEIVVEIEAIIMSLAAERRGIQ